MNNNDETLGGDLRVLSEDIKIIRSDNDISFSAYGVIFDRYTITTLKDSKLVLFYINRIKKMYRDNETSNLVISSSEIIDILKTRYHILLEGNYDPFGDINNGRSFEFYIKFLDMKVSGILSKAIEDCEIERICNGHFEVKV